ncbi:MAG: hypothetical protein ACKOEX_00185 [Planctomycetia bacterium]
MRLFHLGIAILLVATLATVFAADPQKATLATGARDSGTTFEIPIAPLPPEFGLKKDEATATPPPRTHRMESLRRQIAHVLGLYRKRPLTTMANNPWEVMHWGITWGAGAQVKVGGTAGDLDGAFEWLNRGRRCNGQVMVAVDRGRLVALQGKGMQGHAGQYLAVMAQSRLPRSTPFQVDGKRFTIDDMIESEKRACVEKSELTFILISMAHYLDTDATWKSADGTTWSIPKLVEEELEQPIHGAPCGGTHRLFALGFACQKRREATGGLDGIYVRANRYYRLHHQRMFSELQNRDGSFSTAWFEKPEDAWDVERKLRTTGHMLEFLVSTADQQVLYHPKTVEAVEFLAGILEDEPEKDWKIGPMCHALHALAIYQERAWSRLTPDAIAAYHGPMKAQPQPPMSKSEGPVFPASISRIQSLFR